VLHLCFLGSPTDRVTRMNWQDEPKLLPEASLGRRVIALVIDWTMSRLIASLIGPYLSIQTDFNTLVIFYLEVTLLTILFQASAGQRIMAVKVVSYPEQFRVPATKIALRTLLICMVVPAVFTKDGRSLHDFLTKTQTVRELY
jgi:uncharacterized RDD family membrane protein YckC